MQTTNTPTEQIACDRVANSAALAAHAETIWADWDNMDEHIEWVVTAPEAEIIEWCETIERDLRDA